MPETCSDIYDNKSQLLHQVGTSHHFNIHILFVMQLCHSAHTFLFKLSVVTVLMVLY